MFCDIYRASTREGMYFYFPANLEIDTILLQQDANAGGDPLIKISDALKRAFGRPTFVMRLELSAERQLARVPVLDVIQALAGQGYYLQLPLEGLISPNAVAPEGLRGA